MNMLKRTENVILLCCGKSKCPEVALVEDNHVTITDDHGGKVKIEMEQAELLGQALEQLKTKK